MRSVILLGWNRDAHHDDIVDAVADYAWLLDPYDPELTDLGVAGDAGNELEIDLRLAERMSYTISISE